MASQPFFPEPLADPLNAAARRMGISRAGAYNLINRGALTAVKAGRRTLVLRTEQQRFVDALPIKTPSAPRSA